MGRLQEKRLKNNPGRAALGWGGFPQGRVQQGFAPCPTAQEGSLAADLGPAPAPGLHFVPSCLAACALHKN